MNKAQFIQSVAEKAEMSRAAAARAVSAIFDTASGAIAEAVSTAGELSIPGFGKFAAKKRAPRKGRNPRTGTTIQIPARTSVSFSAGKGLKDSVSGDGTARKKPATKTATKSSGSKASAGGSSRTGAAKSSSGSKSGASVRSSSSGSRSTASRSSGSKATGSKASASKSTASKSTASKSTAPKSSGAKSGGAKSASSGKK